MNGKAVGGIILMILGGTFVLGLFGLHLGGLFSLVLGGVLIYWGYTKWQEQGWTFSSIALLALGIIVIFGGIGGVISLALGLLLIYGGYRLLKPKAESSTFFDESDDSYDRPRSNYDSIDEEFARLMNK